ncbi:hypothetical protein [Bradyrhizobium sp. 143]|uniref:hypothetical protein n=1 Tax=Bradyrhizobium sp. 143 TaxID=2782619 RepID=UPI001FF8FA51|nr:hypothetical protein [Bradyrhizobium sp. 143]MCK1711711.1 hypothetical protein [Bradyrhizobium sp. 143]
MADEHAPLPRHKPTVRKPWFSAVFRDALGGAVEAPHGAAPLHRLPEPLRFHTATWPRQAKLAAALSLQPGPTGDASLADPVTRLRTSPFRRGYATSGSRVKQLTGWR